MKRKDDLVAAFSLYRAPVRGRVVRIGPGALDPILRRHDYPRPVALLLGEALALAALFGSLLKAEGRVVVQAEGDGPISLLVAEHSTGGGLRGYARLRENAAAELADAHNLPPMILVGNGHMTITLDQGPGRVPHQGIIKLGGETLSECAESYFYKSEQITARLLIAVGEAYVGDAPPVWRAGGVLIQMIAADEARGDPEDEWPTASIFFDTLGYTELVDPDLPADLLVYRLFHELGVRMGEPAPLEDRCTCDEQRLIALMKKFTAEEVADLVEPDGKLHAKCQFCGRVYYIATEKIGA